MSTLLERLLPAIEQETTSIRQGNRKGLCHIIRTAGLDKQQCGRIQGAIDSSALLYRYGSVFATSALIQKGRKDSAMCAPFIDGGPGVTFDTLDSAGLAWVADKWEEWAIGIVKSVAQEV